MSKTLEISVPSLPVHWKPLLVAACAIAEAAWDTLSYPNLHDALADPAFPHRLGMALLVAILAAVAKQKNVTGGDVGQPSTYKAMTDSLPIEKSMGSPAPPVPAPKSESLSIQS